MAGPDVLSSGPDAPPPSRRWLIAGVVLALALGVPALLHSTGGSRSPSPAVPTAAASPAALPDQDTQPIVVSVTAGARYAYALVAACGNRILHDCDYRVYRRNLVVPGWAPTPVHFTGTTTTGLDVTMRATPDDHVLLTAGTSMQVSDDGGDTVHILHLRTGPPVDALPAGAVLASELCPTCADAVTAVDLSTGELRPLRSQPTLSGFGLRLARVDGNVLWVAQVGPSGGLTAVSADRGRSWRTIPLAAGMVLTDPVVLASVPGGGAYLVGRRPNDLPDVRRIDGPGGDWRRITPPDGPNSAYSAVVDARGLLVGDGNGKAWRLGPDDRFTALPGTPGYLSGSRVLLGLPSTPGTVELSYDGGQTWQSEQPG
jgi:hypothetical protein